MLPIFRDPLVLACRLIAALVWVLLSGLAIIAALLLWPLAAFAQATTTVDTGALFAQVEPTLEAGLGVVVFFIVGLIAWSLHRLIGITIDTKMRAMLQGALENAAHNALASAQGSLDGKTLDLRSHLVVDALDYLRKYIPGVLRHFNLTDASIAELLRVQVAKLLPKEPALAA